MNCPECKRDAGNFKGICKSCGQETKCMKR